MGSSDLIGNIMTWVKTQGEEFKPQLTSVEMNELLQKSLEDVRSAFSPAHAKVEFYLPSNPYFIRCDAQMMASILRNLLSNAMKATAADKKITIRINEEPSKVRIAVEDEGIGLTSEQIQSILTSSYTVKEGAGYGFGLTLVRHFIDLHQGELKIKSLPGKGSEFLFSIPC